jgi:hypothetical protein
LLVSPVRVASEGWAEGWVAVSEVDSEVDLGADSEAQMLAVANDPSIKICMQIIRDLTNHKLQDSIVPIPLQLHLVVE